jgi:hypothetical protein
MSSPVSQRKADVFAKLGYAEQRYQELMGALTQAQREDRDPKYLTQAAADVVGAAREVFDYLGQDIFELHLLPHTTNQNLRKKHAEGRLNMYFPFHPGQITRVGADLHELKTINLALYDVLAHFVDAAEKDLPIEGMSLTYGRFLQMKDMVNEKKHDKLNACVATQNEQYLVEGNGATFIFPKGRQKNVTKILVEEGLKTKEIAEYRFVFNDTDVRYFCMFAVHATKMVLRRMYDAHFAADAT